MKKFVSLIVLALALIGYPSVAVAAPAISATPQGSTAVLVAWTGSDGYLVELKVGGVQGTTLQSKVTTTEQSHTFTGLSSGVDYSVVLTAGTGATSSATVSTPESQTGAPRITSVGTPCVLRVNVEWLPPNDTGTSAIVKYDVTAYVGPTPIDSMTTSELKAELSGFASSSDAVVIGVTAVDAAGARSNEARTTQLLQPNSTTPCPEVQQDSADEDSPSTGGGGGGGGSVSEGEALPGVPRSLAGSDRVATSIAVAEADFVPVSSNPSAQAATLQARAAVIASSASFPDALSAGPLAYAKVAPLLLTGSNSLDSRVASTLTKLVPAGSTVYVIGGEAAVSPNVTAAISNLGFTVQRIAGVDRYATSVEVARALGNPSMAFAATGLNFPDALAAGVVAARQSGSILLTRGNEIPIVVAGYLLENPTVVVAAVGGPAATAFPAATKYSGADRYATAVELAKAFPPSSITAGVASGLNFPDGLVAAPYLARRGGVLLLTQQIVVPSVTANYIRATTKIDVLQVFGGLSVVSDTARRTLATFL